MLDREWVSIVNPDDPHDRYIFDASFLLSNYSCIYGAGCPGTNPAGEDPERACCRLGAHYTDEEDREQVEAMVEVLGPRWMQHHRDATRRGVTVNAGDGEVRTRIKDGACIFLNRSDFPTGAGCSLHHYAMDRGEHHMTYKPEVCWIVPLRREVEEGYADDGEEMWTTTITSYDRGAWGPGGADFLWWCTDSAEAYVGAQPVFRSMESELRTMVGDSVYDELAQYLESRMATAQQPLPFPVFVNGQRQP
jgi:hypothetical protein